MLPASGLGLARVGVAVFALAYEDGGWHEHTVADHKQNRRRCERQESVDRRNAQQNCHWGSLQKPMMLPAQQSFMGDTA